MTWSAGSMRKWSSLVLSVLACECGQWDPPRVPEDARPALAPRAATPSAPLIPVAEGEVSAGGTRSLEVPGFEPALLYSPPGAALRPLLIAAHGAGGSPEWECEYWRRLTEGRAFLLCLRGTPLGTYDGFYYRNHIALERELVAAERVARASEPRIALGGGIYAGFSQGSTMGTAMIAAHGAAFPFLVLIENFELWNVPRARAFARAGGKRVLIACGSRECQKVGKESLRWLRAGGLDARLEFAPGAGHTPAGPVMDRVRLSLPWLMGDERLWL